MQYGRLSFLATAWLLVFCFIHSRNVLQKMIDLQPTNPQCTSPSTLLRVSMRDVYLWCGDSRRFQWRPNLSASRRRNIAPFPTRCRTCVWSPSYNRRQRIATWNQWCKVLEDKLASRPKFCSQPRTRPRRNVLGLNLKHLSSAWPRTFYLGLVKMSVMKELVIIVSLQRLSTKVIYLLTLCYWYKLVQVHVHGSI